MSNPPPPGASYRSTPLGQANSPASTSALGFAILFAAGAGATYWMVRGLPALIFAGLHLLFLWASVSAGVHYLHSLKNNGKVPAPHPAGAPGVRVKKDRLAILWQWIILGIFSAGAYNYLGPVIRWPSDLLSPV